MKNIRTRSMKTFIATIVIIIICIAFAGCGVGSGYSEGEQFTFGENTYALERLVRVKDKDTDSTECYGVSLLQVGYEAPVIISGFFGNGNMSTKSAIDMTLKDGDTTYSTRSISFAATDEVEGYGSRAVFYFDIPKGTDLPTSAILWGSDDEETVELNLSGVTAEEETTATTTTTTESDIPAAPDAGNYNNEGIGDPSVYDSLGTFGVEFPDLP